jgi:hypothetical protein
MFASEVGSENFHRILELGLFSLAVFDSQTFDGFGIVSLMKSLLATTSVFRSAHRALVSRFVFFLLPAALAQEFKVVPCNCRARTDKVFEDSSAQSMLSLYRRKPFQLNHQTRKCAII